MRILHTEWSDGWGGQEIRIISEMEVLREKGIEFFLATREHAKIKEEALKRGFKVYTLPFKGNFDLTTIAKLTKIIKEEKIDIVNTHSGKDTWVGGIAAKLTKAKFIRTRHLANPINPSRLNFINEIADFIITTGEKVKEDMIKNNRINPSKIVSIPTGVDEEVFNPKKYNKLEDRKAFNLSKNRLIIGALGVLRSVKRHEDFIKAAKILNSKYNNLEFVIAGDGPLKEKLINLTKDLQVKIKFLGHINNPQNYLSAIDILVNPSKSEGVPQAVIQALMMNKAVVATDVGSVKDLYKHNFLLAKPLNIENLAQKIEKLIIDKNLRESLSKNARNSVINEFSLTAMKNKLLNIYERIL